ncbi:FecR family protein [Bacteroides sp. 519]|uniref:FecR family protein n=1 Tax=Bacteroides sp. 519 TaxID=2302937 RepID=UPI0013D6D174|nr:FecR domain-containing protein [Bacteroides sp. 519]NDV59410.1 DUF4974 domain-containing protein [Bacteroides sp. 519]
MNNIPYELIARYLAGECNDDEKAQLHNWSSQHPELMDELTRIWQETPSENFNPDIEQALQTVGRRIDAKSKPQLRKLILWFSSAAAVILIAIGIITFWNVDSSPTTPVTDLLTLQSDTGIVEYTLPDGSKVWLNASSFLQYPEAFTGNTREVHLDGEAFFDIAPNADKPFIIHANNTLTRVVGTSFAVRAIKDESEVVVTVSTGVINFSAEGETEHLELRPGEQGVCITEEKKLAKNTDPDPNTMAWKTKVLVFKHTPVTEVAQLLENVYHTPVEADASVANLQLNATYEQLTLEEIIEVIEISLGIKAEWSERGYLIRK